MYNPSIINLWGILSLLLLILTINTATYNYSTCPSSSFLHTSNLACKTCPTNQISNTYQMVPINCQCSTGYISTTGGSCSLVNTNGCSANNNNFYPIWKLDGSYDTSITSAACTLCASNARTNRYLCLYKAMALAAPPAALA
jgi:hypothetical protein